MRQPRSYSPTPKTVRTTITVDTSPTTLAPPTTSPSVAVKIPDSPANRSIKSDTASQKSGGMEKSSHHGSSISSPAQFRKNFSINIKLFLIAFLPFIGLIINASILLDQSIKRHAGVSTLQSEAIQIVGEMLSYAQDERTITVKCLVGEQVGIHDGKKQMLEARENTKTQLGYLERFFNDHLDDLEDWQLAEIAVCIESCENINEIRTLIDGQYWDELLHDLEARKAFVSTAFELYTRSTSVCLSLVQHITQRDQSDSTDQLGSINLLLLTKEYATQLIALASRPLARGHYESSDTVRINNVIGLYETTFIQFSKSLFNLDDNSKYAKPLEENEGSLFLTSVMSDLAHLKHMENITYLTDFSMERSSLESSEVDSAGADNTFPDAMLWFTETSTFTTSITAILRELSQKLLDSTKEELRSAFGFIIMAVITLVLPSVLTAIVVAFAVKQISQPFKRLRVVKTQLKRQILDQMAQCEAASKFVPYEILSLLGRNSLVDVQLGDQTLRILTVMVIDIVSFTTIASKMTPDETFKFLNGYLANVVPLLQSRAGIIDKFSGDGILILFSSATHAVDGALDVMKYLNERNAETAFSGGLRLNVGIGMHSGEVVIGTIGHQNRMDTTIVSDTVNVAHRVEALTRLNKCNIIVTRQTFQQLATGTYCIRYIGTTKVKGRDVAVEIFEVYDTDSDSLKEQKAATAYDFDVAVRRICNGDIDSARQLLANSVLPRAPDDLTAQSILSRLGSPGLIHNQSFSSSSLAEATPTTQAPRSPYFRASTSTLATNTAA